MFRDIELKTDELYDDASGRRVIAVIGIDQYRAWPRLSNAVNDARAALGTFLRLGFEQLAAPLFDEAATAAALRTLVTDTLARLTKHDRLVLFFAGHGHTVTRTFQDGDVIKTGYIIPVDGERPGGSTSHWLRLDSWLSDVARLEANHVLVFLDACHSGIALGTLVKWRDSAARAEPLARLTRRRSRRVITSAQDGQRASDVGPVPRHSLFTGCLIEALDGGVAQQGELVTGSQIGLYLQHRVASYPGSEQMPDFGALEEDKRGELVIRIVTTAAQAEAAARAREEAKAREAAAATAHEEAASRARQEMDGVMIGQYRITGTIGQGGMGVVYAGAHVLLGRPAAIKVLLPELSQKQDMVMRFFNEAKAATAIRHPGIVEIYDFGWSAEGAAFIVMEHLEGETLARRMERGRISWKTALSMVRQISGALGAAHSKGIVHRDLKPDNIFLVLDSEVPGGERTKLLDFGIAKLAGDPEAGTNVTRTGAVMGTPTYMSPEQCRGVAVDHRADLYSLGCIAFELCAGRPPFIGEGMGDVLAAHIHVQVPSMATLGCDLPWEVESLVCRLLAKLPAQRVQSTAELIRTIDAIGAGGAGATAAASHRMWPSVTAPPITTLSGAASARTAGSTRAGGRRALVIGSAAAAVIAVATMAIVAVVMRAPGAGSNHVGLGDASAAAMAADDSPGNVHSGSNTMKADDTSVANPSTDVVAADAPIVISAVPATTVKPEDEKKCLEAQAARDWQGLIDCAKGLEAAGAKDKAKEFQAKALKEQDNELKAGAVTLALKEKNLKEAEVLLAKIGDGSVYYKALSDQFSRAEAPLRESNLRQAQVYAANHDCAGLRQWKVQAAATTTRIFEEVRGVKCTEKGQQPDPVEIKATPGSNAEPAVPTPPKSACDTLNVDDLESQAASQYRAGYPKPALALLFKVLPCKQDARTYRLVVMYACDGKDAATAKQYFPKVPAQFQASVEQKCQQMGIIVRP